MFARFAANMTLAHASRVKPLCGFSALASLSSVADPYTPGHQIKPLYFKWLMEIALW